MAVITSATTGPFGTGATWTGGVTPVEGDSVIIANTHVVTVDGTYIVGNDTATAVQIQSGGTLKASRTVNSELTIKGDFIPKTGSTLDYGTSADPIPVAYTSTLKLNYSATLVAGKYGLKPEVGAKIFFFGAVKTINTTITDVGGIAGGATSATIANAVGWNVGDTLVFQSTNGTVTGNDIRTISTITFISGTSYTVTFAATTYDHAQNARVGNFTSNVTVTAYSTNHHHRMYLLHDATSAANLREIQYTAIWYRRDNTAAFDWIRGAGTNNVWISASNNMFYQGSGITLFGWTNGFTITNCAVYASGSYGVYVAGGAWFNLTDWVIYRTNGNGIQSSYGSGGQGCVFTNCHVLSCPSIFVNLPTAIGFTFNDCTFHSTNTAFNLGAGLTHTFNRCSIASSDLPGTPVGSIFARHGQNSLCPIVLNDCKLKASWATAFAQDIDIANPGHSIVIANKNVDPSLQEIYKPAGTIVRDNTSKLSGVVSLKMSPISASVPLSFSIKIPAPNGNNVGVSGDWQRDTANTLTATLSGLGITPVVYTASAAINVTEQFALQATQSTGTDGFLTLTFSITGAAGNVWVDKIAAPQAGAIDFGEFGFWADGLPAGIATASYVSAGDVHNYLAANVTVPGSMGALLKTVAQTVDDNQALIISK